MWRPLDPVLGARYHRCSTPGSRRPGAREQEPCERRIRKRDRWLKTELTGSTNASTAWTSGRSSAIRDRLDDVEGWLDDLQLQVDDVRDDRRESDKPIANLEHAHRSQPHRPLRSNQAGLDAEHRLLLNEVFEQLARNPQGQGPHHRVCRPQRERRPEPQLSEQRA